jgi:hypothetical protein
VERFIRTLTEQLLCVRTFRTVEELRHALAGFRERYNQRWIVQRQQLTSPRSKLGANSLHSELLHE